MMHGASGPIGWPEILGLRDFRDGSATLVRAEQLRELSRRSAVPMIALGLIAGLVIWWFIGRVPTPLLAGWAVILGLLSISVGKARHKNLNRRGEASLKDHHRAIFNSVATALFWTLPLLFFAPYGGVEDAIMLGAVALVVMSASAVSLTTLPLGGLAITGIVGAALAFMFAQSGQVGIAGVAGGYAICLSYGILINGRAALEQLRDRIKLDEKEKMLSLLLRDSQTDQSDWIWQIDARKCIQHPSPRFSEASGIEAAQLTGMPLLELLAGPRWQHEEIDDRVRNLLDLIQRGRTFSDIPIRYMRKGEERWWQISGSPRIDTEGRITSYRGVFADITERRKTERRTHHMAHYDALTGLPNRAYTNDLLQNRIAHSLKEGSSSAFLMIDLDRFKVINDTLGHPVGDKLLEQVASRLQSLMKDGDVAGRLGGDEFAVVIAHTGSGDEVDSRAERIIRVISQPYQIDDQSLHIGASIGSAICPKDGRSAPALLRHADLALYRAKEGGRGVHVRYEPSFSRKADERRQIENSLRGAIERGELYLAYQPVITLSDREISGFEALLRWKSDALGSVPPAVFLPIAEETRLIDPIGEWVFRQACVDAANWPENYRLAINLSEVQLRNPNLATVIVSAVTQAGLAPHRLEVETTEAVLRSGNEMALETFAQLNAIGITVALDDFGTGHSTLRYIGDARFSSIKIDNSFIRNAQEECEASIAVFKAVVAMANSLNIATIAEGVENEAQFDLAKSLGCSQVQGYFLDRPMSAEDVMHLVREDLASAVA
ncbi:EAL domain-containing protein [uncultured Parasphingopyxis sp.]|uniref:putative bifunctional diguanylate cyclase/phosphodiesterase n=1 Tax=uncultured Parasphingopyxis sp. TaxID=1547918 RepID=UPI00260DFDB5|nr:EAL domain-containing protein [uncultured Parasphingopyxis sp.]